MHFAADGKSLRPGEEDSKSLRLGRGRQQEFETWARGGDLK